MSEHLGSVTATDNDRNVDAEPRIVTNEETTMKVIIQLIQKHREEDQLERSRTRADIVRQSNIQLTCSDYRRNCVKSRLRSSLLNCTYTLQVLQQVATND